MTFEEIVSDFIRRWRRVVEEDLVHFKNQRSLKGAIRAAALCERPDGKRESHQRRLSRAVLEEAEESLQHASGKLKVTTSFGILHDTVKQAIGDIHGIGDLAVYDIAVRIGAYLGLSPTLVYLHSGARTGAKRLGFSGATVTVGELPNEFRRLSADEIESCFCIYKECFPGGAHSRHSAASCLSSLRPPCGGVGRSRQSTC